MPDLKTWISILSVSLALTSIAVVVGVKLKVQEDNTKKIDRLFVLAEKQADSIAGIESSLKAKAVIVDYLKLAMDRNTARIDGLKSNSESN